MAKTATFGILHVVTSFTVTYALTGNLTVAGVVTFVEPLVNTVMHYFFDAYWDHPRAQALRQRMRNANATRAADQLRAYFSTKARSIT
jgi:uncharacterized membrane protein